MILGALAATFGGKVGERESLRDGHDASDVRSPASTSSNGGNR
jgi:hypothetical protein